MPPVLLTGYASGQSTKEGLAREIEGATRIVDHIYLTRPPKLCIGGGARTSQMAGLSRLIANGQ